MIQRAFITAWRASAPWPTDAQVEQDLILSRALVELFRSPTITETLAFRGGTALHKLFLTPSGRYSEDIDLVQVSAGPIGRALNAVRDTLDPWLGAPKHSRGYGRVTAVYRFDTTSRPAQRMRLKIEINTREHFTVLGAHRRRFAVDNGWFTGKADVNTYRIEELLGTKLRALYQRMKGRDLYDLWYSLTTFDFNPAKVIECFEQYMRHGGTQVSRAQFEANLSAKLGTPRFLADITPLLPAGVTYDAAAAGALVHERLISMLPGEPWKAGFAI